MINRFTIVLSLASMALLMSVSLHATPLRIDVIEGAKFGYGYDGVNTNRESASFEFPGQPTDLVLSYRVYDIDARDEVAIEINGKVLAQAVMTADRQTREGTMTIPSDRIRSGENTIVFRQRVPGYVWGLTDLRLRRDSTQTGARELILDVTDDDAYGFRYRGQDGQREGVSFEFRGTGEDLILYYTAYDIDARDEVAIELNGMPIGHLVMTGDRDVQDDFVILPASSQLNGRNSLVLRQRVPGYSWGVSSLLVVEADWCL